MCAPASDVHLPSHLAPLILRVSEFLKNLNRCFTKSRLEVPTCLYVASADPAAAAAAVAAAVAAVAVVPAVAVVAVPPVVAAVAAAAAAIAIAVAQIALDHSRKLKETMRRKGSSIGRKSRKARKS